MDIDQAPRRLRIVVQGVVQGVGFRPFVYSLARRLGLAGFVLNDSAGVAVEIEGAPDSLADFQRALREERPPLARVDSILVKPLPLQHETTFVITKSQASGEGALISPDSAPCDDCLREIMDRADPRYRYPFTNCTNCGPRFTIIQGTPYDREKTTMRAFSMCSRCRSEYADPLNRRFFAQPNACPNCGPQVRLLDGRGQPLEELDPIVSAARRLAGGAILAVKGLGGYHLVCDALNDQVVQRLRQRKGNRSWPLAVILPDVEAAHRLCQISEAETALLTSHQRPIVPLRLRSETGVAPSVISDLSTVGVRLPHTPLDYLLLRDYAAFAEPERPIALISTSYNYSGKPIIYRDDEAITVMPHLADGMLTHNRQIATPCEDSAAQVVTGGELLLRRSRGHVPNPITLLAESPVPLLALGGRRKNTFCLVKGNLAFVSQHIGDLTTPDASMTFNEAVRHFQQVFDIRPEVMAHDLDPSDMDLPVGDETAISVRIAVQHHHAHIAAILAEHNMTGPVIGLAADGGGYGVDSAIWGCELLIADLFEYKRMAHLAYMPIHIEDEAEHSARRTAAALLRRAFGEAMWELDIPFVRALDRGRCAPTPTGSPANTDGAPASSSSLGHLFDAIRALLELGHAQPYLAWPPRGATDADDGDTADIYPFAISSGMPAQLDLVEAIRGIVTDLQHEMLTSHIARRFHNTVIEILAVACQQAQDLTGLNVVALGGDLFQNRLLLEPLMARLQTRGFEVLTNRLVPPGDGGLSLGQSAVALVRLRRAREQSQIA